MHKLMKRIVVVAAMLLCPVVCIALEVVANSGASGSSQNQVNNYLSTVDTTINAQIEDLQEFIEEIEFCNKHGLIYGPGASGANDMGCVQAEESDPHVLGFANLGEDGMPICDGEWDFLTAVDSDTLQCASLPAPTYTYAWESDPNGCCMFAAM